MQQVLCLQANHVKPGWSSRGNTHTHTHIPPLLFMPLPYNISISQGVNAHFNDYVELSHSATLSLFTCPPVCVCMCMYVCPCLCIRGGRCSECVMHVNTTTVRSHALRGNCVLCQSVLSSSCLPLVPPTQAGQGTSILRREYTGRPVLRGACWGVTLVTLWTLLLVLQPSSPPPLTPSTLRPQHRLTDWTTVEQ